MRYGDLILGGVVIIQAVIHHFERKDMYNRIMSKDLGEYRSGGEYHQKHRLSAHDRLMRNWRRRDDER